VNKPNIRRKHLPLPATLLLLSLAGCATVPAPNESLDLAQNAIADAQRDGAAEFAPSYLQAAQNKLTDANREAARSDGYIRAVRLAEEAQADAQLAAAMARATKADRSATELDQSLSALRTESERAAPGDLK
jgi:uncharacterized protein DUF4398